MNLENTVKSCAWCIKPGTESVLPEGQVYSHGICPTHKVLFIREYLSVKEAPAKLKSKKAIFKNNI